MSTRRRAKHTRMPLSCTFLRFRLRSHSYLATHICRLRSRSRSYVHMWLVSRVETIHEAGPHPPKAQRRVVRFPSNYIASSSTFEPCEILVATPLKNPSHPAVKNLNFNLPEIQPYVSLLSLRNFWAFPSPASLFLYPISRAELMNGIVIFLRRWSTRSADF